MAKQKVKPKKRINSRSKGCVGERELSQFLREHGYDARRGQQFSGGGESPDVVHNLPGVHLECKRVESLQLFPALAQAQRDCAGKVPVVVHRKNRTEWVAILRFEDLLNLLLLTPEPTP